MNLALRNIETVSRHFERCELVLVAIDNLEKPTLDDIVNEAGIPQRTMQAIFRRLEDQHRVVIERVNGRRHGYYKIADWGNLDRSRVISHIAGRVNGGISQSESTEKAESFAI